MIRPLEPNEVHLMLEAGNAFYLEGNLPGKFNNDVFLRRTRQLIESDGVIFASFTDEGEFRGALAVTVCECMFTGNRMAVECFWYILPRFRGGLFGVKLLQTFDRWSKINKIDVGAMIHLIKENPEGGLKTDQLEETYKQMGFRPVEKMFIKVYSKQLAEKEGVTS